MQIRKKFEKKNIETLLLTDLEVAHILNMGRTSVWMMAKRGELRPIKLGMRMTRFSKDEVMRLAGKEGAA